MNPWVKLPTSRPFVLGFDRSLVDAFNVRANAREMIDTSLLPEPFLGRPDAPVVLLGLNPGWSPEDAEWHGKQEFALLCRANLVHEDSRYPFYLLNPILDAPGSRWWSSRLRSLIERVGLETVAQGVLCVEYFPYHSATYGERTPRLQSQDYGFALVRNALERNAVIVVLRNKRRWFAELPELETYHRLFFLRSVQNVSISPKNCPEGFAEIIRELQD
jgi:hypothetical protein